jgi:hypothetical protein
MKYIKTFEGHSNSSMIFENVEVGTPEQKDLLNRSFEELSKQEQEAAFKGIEELAAKEGCSVEDFTNLEFVKSIFKNAEEDIDSESLEEGVIGDFFTRTKKFFGNLLNGLGIGLRWAGGLAGSLAMVLSIASGSPDYRVEWMWNESLRSLSRSEEAGVFMAGLAGLAISVIAGHYLSNKGKSMAK